MNTLREIALFIALVLICLDTYERIVLTSTFNRNNERKFIVSIWITLLTWLYVPTAILGTLVTLIFWR